MVYITEVQFTEVYFWFFQGSCTKMEESKYNGYVIEGSKENELMQLNDTGMFSIEEPVYDTADLDRYFFQSDDHP